MAGVHDLEPVESGGGHAFGSGREVRDDAIHIEILERLGEGPVRCLPRPRGRDQRQPVAGEVRRPVAQMGRLDHDGRALVVAVSSDRGQPRNHLVGGQVDIAERGGGVLRHDGRTADHRQTDTAAGLLPLIEAVAVLRHAELGVRGLVRGRDDAVAQRESAELEWLEQRIGRRVHRRRGRCRCAGCGFDGHGFLLHCRNVTVGTTPRGSPGG